MFSKIAIVGSGAIGTFYGARLALAGADVRFLMRNDLAAVQARGSVILEDRAGKTELRPVQAYGTSEEIGPVNLVIVTLKTTANAALAALIPPLLGPKTAIFTLQNGLGSDEQLAALFGPERVLGGLAFIAATRTAPGVIKCYHPGRIALGEFAGPASPRARELAAQLVAAGLETTVVDSVLEARWRKLVWNIPFNGLAIAHDSTTDLICADPALTAEVHALMREVQTAARAFGFSIPDDFLQKQYEFTPPMGPYQPSSLVDYRAGREVELETIWGEPLRRALAAGVAMPRMQALYAELHGKLKL